MKHFFSFIIVCFLASCTKKTDYSLIKINRVNDWSNKIIYSKDSILAKKDFYKNEVKELYDFFEKSKQKQIIAKIDFINARILSYTNQDSLANVFFKQSMDELDKEDPKNTLLLIEGYYNLFIENAEKGYLNASLDLLSKAVYYAEKNSKPDSLFEKRVLSIYKDFGVINRAVLNNQLSLKYLDKSINIAKKLDAKLLLIKLLAEKATTLSQLNNYNDAILTMKEAEVMAVKNNMGKEFVYEHFGVLYGNQKNNRKALYYFEKQAKVAVEDLKNSISFSINISGAYLGLNNPKKATPYIMFLESKFNTLSDYYKVSVLYNLVEYYIQIKNFEKASFYHSQSENFNNSYYSSEKAMYSEDLSKKYEVKKNEDQIQLLNQKNKTLDEESKNKSLYILISILSILITLTIGFTLYLKQKNKKLELETRIIQIEDKLLRSQMEPHFVFNAMSSLQSLILENKNKESSYYLAKFARVLRLSLEHSRKKYVSLTEEIEAIESYLELQKLRFGDLFIYKIESSILNKEHFEVPPMMIQPLIENAIYHGFKNIDYQGNLHVSFKLLDKFIECTVKDNGKGFVVNKSIVTTEKTSLSTIITKERLAILTNSKHSINFIEINNNLKNQNGTNIKIKLPYIKE